MPSYKRKRGESVGAGAGAGSSRRVSGYTIERRMYPASGYMRMYAPRSAETLAAYGKDRRSATPAQLAYRDEMRVFGRGRYSVGKNWRKVSQSLGLAGAGKRLIGAGTGAAVSMLGQGAYTANSLVDTDMSAVPFVSSGADETGSVTVCRREYLKDVYAPGPSVAFAVDSISINPGIVEAFPWLSQVAANYEEYDIQQLVYTYRSTVTDIGTSTNGQCGTIIMATNYNAASDVFGDKAAMMEYDGAMSAKVTSDMVHGVECDDSKRSGPDAHYVRTGPVGAGQDVKTYDHGLFQLGIGNCPYASGTALGELWVSYTVVLRKPKFGVARGALIGTDIFVSGNGTETALNPLGTNAGLLQGQANSIGCTLNLTTTQAVLTFPNEFSGLVRVCYTVEGGATGPSAPFLNPTIAGNIRTYGDMYPSTGGTDLPGYSNIIYGSGAGAFYHEAHFFVSPVTSATLNTITYTVTTAWATVATQGSIRIEEMSPMLSYKSLAIGPVGLRTDAPVLINAAGTVVVP